ncbi:hypothetical protein ABPG73_006219 [Tetrahymena malaccensis]
MKIQQLFKKNCLYFIILLFLINQKVYFFTESQEEHEDFCNPTYPQSNYYNEEFINNKEEICQLLNDNGYKLVKEITYGNYTEVYKIERCLKTLDPEKKQNLYDFMIGLSKKY